jgi:hypothetical protein
MTDTTSTQAEAFLSSVQATPAAAEKAPSMSERREAAADSQEDALDAALAASGAFDDLDGEDEPEETPNGASARERAEKAERKAKGEKDVPEDEEGEADEAEDDLDEPSVEADDEDEESEYADEEEEDQDIEEALDRATEKLRAAKVPMSVIRKTARETLIAWAASMDGDGEDAPATSGSKPESGKASASAAATKSGAESPTVDWKSVSAAMADELGIDPEHAERAFKPLVSVVEKALADRLEKVEAFHREALESRGRERIENNIRRLSEAYPKLKTNPRLAEQLKAKAITLARGYQAGGEKIPSADALFDEAASIVLGSARRSQDLAAKRRNGVSRAPEHVGSRSSSEHGSMGDWLDEQMRLVEHGQVGRALANAPPKQAKDRNRW